MKFKTGAATLLATGLLFLTGCQTRSISDSGYDSGRYGSARFGYTGELSEFQVLGITAETTVSEAEIQTALQTRGGARLTRASKVLVIQSGADFPDAPMLEALNAQFTVAPFSGRPPREEKANASYAKSIRLAAARGGYDKIFCYWGILESEKISQATKTVSWVPIVGFAIPDERQNMRLRLKAAVVDVASGQWSLVSPPPVSSSEFSSIVTRRNKDQSLVATLKLTGYQNLVRSLAEHQVD
ncbi:MAG TPA: hypothetical protein VHO24_20785 [Opitutaceae bacterium]|nr:hypothetical protein [Opitutaceae bacterium]